MFIDILVITLAENIFIAQFLIFENSHIFLLTVIGSLQTENWIQTWAIYKLIGKETG